MKTILFAVITFISSCLLAGCWTVQKGQKSGIIVKIAKEGKFWGTYEGEIILKRREGYRQAFKQFDVQQVAQMTDSELLEQLNNPNIIRNRLKIFSARQNAQVFLKIQQEYGTFDAYVWQFVNHTPKLNRPETMQYVPTQTQESNALSKDLKQRGMSFVGSTIMYAYMQAIGMVNDHIKECFCCPS